MTDDVEAIVSGLHADGIEVMSIEDRPQSTDGSGIATLPGMRIACVCDPDGQVLSIFELTGT